MAGSDFIIFHLTVFERERERVGGRYKLTGNVKTNERAQVFLTRRGRSTTVVITSL